MIKCVDQKLHEALAHLAALDRNLADLTRAQARCAKADRKLVAEAMQKPTAELLAAYRDFSELLELAETPHQLMASA